MVRSTADLRRLKGVGMILGKRLYDAGFDSFAKIALAGEDGLRRVRGISSRTIGSIVEQSREFAGLEPVLKGADGKDFQQRVGTVGDRIENLARTTRVRFGGKMSQKCGKTLNSECARIEDALVRMRESDPFGSKRASKALQKAEKRVTGLEDASLKKVRKGFKKARKAVVKALKHSQPSAESRIASQPPS